MDSRKFDDLTRLFASRASRRSVLKGLAGGAGLGLAAATRITEVAADPACRESGQTCEGNNDCCGGLDCVPGAGQGAASRCVAPGEEPGPPGGSQCREEGHPCEGNQVCCAGLVCVEGAGQGNAARCVPEERPEEPEKPEEPGRPEQPGEVVTALPATGSGSSDGSGSRWLGPLAVIGAGAAMVANRMRRTTRTDGTSGDMS
jgi:hypothetical protein